MIDRDSADFPPKFGPEDAEVEAFLDAAAGTHCKGHMDWLQCMRGREWRWGSKCQPADCCSLTHSLADLLLVVVLCSCFFSGRCSAIFADAGEPVVFTAAGSMTHLTQQQVDALLDTFNTLTVGSSSRGPVRVLWALRKEAQQLLPPHLRSGSSSSNGNSAADTSTDAAAAAGSSSEASNPRLMVSAWVKQTAVLAHRSVGVFITHGGLGSVHEALALGQAVPLVVPFSNGADHVTLGFQLANRGLGAFLKPAELARPGKLLGAVHNVLDSPEYGVRVADVAQQWAKAGYGPKMAAELLSDFAAAAGGVGKEQQ